MARPPVCRLLFLLLAIILLTACDRDRELHGKWVFDRTYTESHLSAQPAAKPESKDFLGEMKAGLAAMLVPQLLDKLDGSTLTITGKEMIITTRDGTGKAEAYEIVERPTRLSWRTKAPDGTISTYTREGDRLASASTGDVHFIAWFNRAGR